MRGRRGETLRDAADRYLRRCFSTMRPPRASELAVELGAERTSLTRAFERETGMSIGFYFRGQQLQRATWLLLTTKLSAREVARKVGFAHPQSFFRAFRRSTGASPAAYRAQKAPTRQGSP